MTKTKLVAAGALTLSALAATYISTNQKSPEITSTQVYTWDCEYPVHKPEAITFTCADGGMYVDEIKWSRWGSGGAQGTGIYHVNDCDPDCADGSFHSERVKVHLLRLTEQDHRLYLRTLVIRSFDGKNLPELGQSFYEWDVMEFAEMMGDL